MADQNNRDFPVSWEEMHRNSKALAWRLVDKGPWTGIIGITRGGLVPACIVARELDIKLVETFCISSYDHQNQRSANILKKPEGVTDGGKGWLVIDDLVDTGNTFRIARDLLPDAHYACLYAKPAGVDTCDTYVMEVSQDTWIHFPWDLEAQYSAPLVTKTNRKA
ncbi:MAG: xanthine phosphoribosyltransferase [Alphaproteobacteria bacterium]|nr:xanthine phosphoribosyltransferase [Alphaproteobacteria bacterium]